MEQNRGHNRSKPFPGPIINVTKREVLGEIAKIYDPLGLASPVTLVMLYRERVMPEHHGTLSYPKNLRASGRAGKEACQKK